MVPYTAEDMNAVVATKGAYDISIYHEGNSKSLFGGR